MHRSTQMIGISATWMTWNSMIDWQITYLANIMICSHQRMSQSIQVSGWRHCVAVEDLYYFYIVVTAFEFSLS